MTLCQKCLAGEINESGKRRRCRNCGTAGVLSFIYECGFCGVEKPSAGWCQNPACNSRKKRLLEGIFFFLCPTKPYYRGLFSYRLALYPYAILLVFVVLPILAAVPLLGFAYVILVVFSHSQLTRRGYAKEEKRDNFLRQQLPTHNED